MGTVATWKSNYSRNADRITPELKMEEEILEVIWEGLTTTQVRGLKSQGKTEQRPGCEKLLLGTLKKKKKKKRGAIHTTTGLVSGRKRSRLADLKLRSSRAGKPLQIHQEKQSPPSG